MQVETTAKHVITVDNDEAQFLHDFIVTALAAFSSGKVPGYPNDSNVPGYSTATALSKHLKVVVLI